MRNHLRNFVFGELLTQVLDEEALGRPSKHGQVLFLHADAAPHILEHSLKVIEVMFLIAAVDSFVVVLILGSHLVRQLVEILVAAVDVLTRVHVRSSELVLMLLSTSFLILAHA